MQEAGRILLMPNGDYAAGTRYEMLDLINHGGASWVCKESCTGQEPSDSNTEYWQRFGTAVDLSNYLQLTGGTLSSPYNVSLTLKNIGAVWSLLKYSDTTGGLGHLGFSDKDTPIFVNAEGSNWCNILHTGNKPTGTYTGNGSATPRTINTGGIGNELLFSAGEEIGIVNYHCGVIFNVGVKQVFYFTEEEMNFRNGILTIATESVYVNAYGGVYGYRVL